MKVYVAGSSKEIDRAEFWIKKLRGVGIVVTSTWPEVVRSVGQNNPHDRTVDQYKQWAEKDFGEVEAADVFWLHLPVTQTIGAYIELGYAHRAAKFIAMSGVHKPIFTPALASVHGENDEDIFDVLHRMANLSSQEIAQLR
jgi:hypothetical protein